MNLPQDSRQQQSTPLDALSPAEVRQQQDRWFAALSDDKARDILGPTDGRPALQPPSQRRLAPRDHWRQLLTVARLARDMAAYAGEREAARQVAFALSGADGSLYRDTLSIIASQAAKSVPMPQIRDIEDRLRALWLAPALVPHLTTRLRRRVPGRTRADRTSLPVEVARGIPITETCERLGLRLHRSGRDYEMTCPSCGGESRSRNCRVYPRSRTGAGRFYCFTCQAKGDGIALVMLVRGVGFADAVRLVAA